MPPPPYPPHLTPPHPPLRPRQCEPQLPGQAGVAWLLVWSSPNLRGPPRWAVVGWGRSSMSTTSRLMRGQETRNSANTQDERGGRNMDGPIDPLGCRHTNHSPHGRMHVGCKCGKHTLTHTLPSRDILSRECPSGWQSGKEFQPAQPSLSTCPPSTAVGCLSCLQASRLHTTEAETGWTCRAPDVGQGNHIRACMDSPCLCPAWNIGTDRVRPSGGRGGLCGPHPHSWLGMLRSVEGTVACNRLPPPVSSPHPSWPMGVRTSGADVTPHLYLTPSHLSSGPGLNHTPHFLYPSQISPFNGTGRD